MSEAATSTPAAPAASSPTQTGTPASSAPASPSPAVQAPASTSPDYAAAAQAAISGKGAAGVREALTQKTQPVESAETTSLNQQQEATPAVDDDLGLSPAQIQALKRAQTFDPDLLKVMPLQNRKAFADRWAQKLSENDRQYSLSRQQKSGEGQPAKDAEAETGKSETAETPQSQQEGQPSNRLSEFSEKGIADFVLKSIEPDAKEAETLADTFGEDGVAKIRQRESRLVSAMAAAQEQAIAPLVHGVAFLLEYVNDTEFDAGLTELRKQPGYDKIDDGGKQKLREAAIANLRANGGKLRDAVKSVASQVFNIDPRLAAQAELAKVANPMLETSGARPSSVTPTQRPQTQEERLRAAAAAAMAGKGRQAVAEAYSA